MASLEWKVTVPEGSTVSLEQERGLFDRFWHGLIGLVMAMKIKVMSFGKMVWKLGSDDPRKVMHGIKVGVALALVSMFYYSRPLYDGVGGAAMWAVMTVVVIFEFTVGGSLYKGINRCIATFTAGALAIGIHWIASKSGDTMEPIIRSTSVFILASAATYSRFIPTIKKWFDYGITIFILTFCLVAVSGYRVEKLIELAVQRLSTITIGIFICLLVAIVVFPVWAGNDLHLLITRNMDKLADSIEGCMDAYFDDDQETDPKGIRIHKSEGYKCVLNSKASEDSLANLARWEPAHGRFNFRYPWGKYQKIGAAMRYCAYCIETLNASITSDTKAPEYLKKHIGDICVRLSLDCSLVLRETSSSIKSMKKSGSIDILIEEMNNSVQELNESLAQPPADNIQITEALSLISSTSLLIEIAKRVKGVVEEVNKLATAANFKAANDDKPDKIEI